MIIDRTFVVEKVSQNLGTFSSLVTVQFDIERTTLFGDPKAERAGRCVDAAIEAFKKEWAK